MAIGAGERGEPNRPRQPDERFHLRSSLGCLVLAVCMHVCMVNKAYLN